MELILLMAMTVDGKIARDSNQFVDWTGKADKKYFVKITKHAGVVIMGSKTYDTMGKPLPGRLNIVLTRDKTRSSEYPNLIYCNSSPREIINHLRKQGYKEVVIIGGSETNTLFAKEITQVHLTVVPKLFGTGLTLFNSSLNINLNFVGVDQLDDDGHLLLKYSVNNG